MTPQMRACWEEAGVFLFAIIAFVFFTSFFLAFAIENELSLSLWGAIVFTIAFVTIAFAVAWRDKVRQAAMNASKLSGGSAS